METVLAHVIWKKAGRDFPGQLDIALDKKAIKLVVDRQTLRECILPLATADEDWLLSYFAPRLGDSWRSAMGAVGAQPDAEKLAYLAARLAADVGRASGLNP
jgi:hypothetical protein